VQVGEGDFFWDENGRNQFPKVAEAVDVQLQKYKAAVAELNRQTGANVDPNADPNDLMASNARGLMAAVSSLPELTERKRAIDKHMNLATHMLKASAESAPHGFAEAAFSLSSHLSNGLSPRSQFK